MGFGGGGGMKTLLLAILAAMVAVLGLTLSVGAQTGDGGSGDADAAQARVIVRVLDRASGGVDNYVMEFGFLPEWAMDAEDPWSDAVATRSGWLSRNRYMSKTTVDRLAAADNRGWLQSSWIEVPASADGAEIIRGRIIARYNPDSRGGLRIEFGFLPEWIINSAGSNRAAVEQYGDDLLPSSRFLSASLISERRGRWLRSSVIQVPPPPPPAPVIDSVSCSPSSPSVGDDVTCTASLSGGAPASYAWSGGASGGSSASYSTSFDTSGSKTVSLTVTNVTGSDSSSTSVTVSASVAAPVIDSLSCSPSSPNVDDDVTCTASLSGGAPASYAWSGGASGGSDASYSTSFDSQGVKKVSLTVTNDGGSASDSVAVTVVNRPPEAVGSISDVAVDVDGSLTVDVSGGFSDPDGDDLTYTAVSDNSAVGVSVSGSSVTVTRSEEGAATVTVTAADPHGGSATQTFEVTIEAVIEAPVVNSISCSPSSPNVDDDVSCTANLSGSTPESYAWSGGASSGSSATYRTSFSTAGGKKVSLTVTNAAGSATETLLLTVAASSNRAPVWGGADDYEPIDWLVVGSSGGGCIRENGLFTDPDGDRLTLTASSTAPAIASVSVTDDTRGPCYGVQALTVGLAYIDMTVTDSHGASASRRVRVQVRPPQPQFTISCTPSAPTVDQDVTCSVAASSGEITGYEWTGGSASGGTTNSTYATSFAFAGQHTVAVVATTDGGWRLQTTLQLTVTDGRAPSLGRIDCSPSSPSVGESVTCSVGLRGDGGAAGSYAWSGGASSGSGGIYTTSFSTAGSKTISVTATNTAGSDSASTTVTVQASVAAPVINSISCSPSSPNVDDDVTCTANLSGSTPDSYAWSGGASNGSGASYSTSFGTSGSKTVSLTVRNTAGSDSSSTTVTVSEAVQAPVIGSISCSPSSPTTDDSVTCTATLSGGTPDSYAWSGGASSGSSASYSTSFGTSGSKTVSLTVRNTGGSDSSSTTVTVSEAVQAPVIDSISCSPSSPNVNESVTCTASLSGGTPEDRYGYAWSGPIGTSAGFSASYSTSFGTSGSKTISLTVTNTAGSDSSSTKVTVQAPAEAPVIDSISCSPSSLNVGDDVTCTATLSGGTPSSYAWIGGDSSTSSASYSTSFGTAGSKTVSLTVRNEAGSDSGSTTVTVQTPVAAPVIDSVSCSPSSPSVGDSVTCTATLSGGTPDSYAWSGGDSSGSSASYSTSFSTSGSKTVSLTVTNTAGSATETLLLTVAASSNRAPVWGGADDYEPIDWLVVGSTHGGCLSDGLFTDPDGDRLTLTASSTAPAIASVSVTDDTRGPCYGVQALTVGLAYIDMTVTDSHGASASRRVRVQVRPPRPQFSISCTPSAPTVDQEVTCSVVVSSGEITGYAWSGGSWTGGRARTGTTRSTYATKFTSAGQHSVAVVATTDGGWRIQTTLQLTVTEGRAPAIHQITCSPSSPSVGESVTCHVSLLGSGGAAGSYAWSGGASSGSSGSYTTTFSTAGVKTISVTVTNTAGSDSSSTTVTVSE